MEEQIVRRPKHNKEDIPKTFVEHLNDLRKYLIRSIVVFLILSTVAFIYTRTYIDELIIKPKETDFLTNKWLCSLSQYLKIKDLCIKNFNLQLINIELAGQFKVHISIALLIGFVVSFPFLVWQIWLFLRPALKPYELKMGRSMIFWVSILFVLGILFGYFVISPFTIYFLGGYIVSPQIVNQITFQSYFSTLLSLVIGTGLLFEIPVLSSFLAKIGIINYKLVKKYRKHAFIVSFVVAAIITPPDAFSMFILALPVYLLYEISIWVVKHVEKRKKIVIENYQ